MSAPTPQPSGPKDVAPSAQPSSAPPPAKPTKSSAQASTTLFHFAECTNCKHLLPLATSTDKYFAILSKDPKKPIGLGERCMRCGADSWVVSTS